MPSAVHMQLNDDAEAFDEPPVGAVSERRRRTARAPRRPAGHGRSASSRRRRDEVERAAGAKPFEGGHAGTPLELGAISS